jgi:signal transduction histidine kinase
MSKNVFDYIFMGLKKNKSIKNRAIEQEKAKEQADKFNKAFTDKTYTVAKKVLDNVEKVADYDYDALFDRVNKAVDSKMPKMTRTLTPEERQNRSVEFEKKVEKHSDRFNIEDYISKEQNYKDSIIEKTKRNIQKKYNEADQRHKEKNDNTSDNDIKVDVNINIGTTKDDNVSKDGKLVEDNLVIVLGHETLDISEDQPNENVTPEDLIEVIDEQIDEPLLDTEVIDDYFPEQIDSDIDSYDTSKSSETMVTDNSKQISLDPSKDEITVEPEVTVIEDTIKESEEVKTESLSESIQSEAFHVPLDDVEYPSDIGLEDSIDLVTDSVDTLLDQAIEESEKPGLRDRITSYSKADLKKSNKYHKKRRKDKFAKRMKVELEDSVIGKQKRSFKRLFKFSLSFKLSFVFMILIILTVISLSVAFYLGIDYVISLKEMGKLDDIQFFKDVLLVLLIIFDTVAILICVSLGTKASRELVRPIDEMTLIVRQINANDMDRRLNVKGMHDELKELAMTFNEMLDRIENSYETQNRFTSDASHELRTPIAVIQGYINMLDRWGKADGEILEESIEAIKSESHNMKRLTEKLLLLAKADKGILEMEFEYFELNDLISEITKETQMIDSSHTITNNINEVKSIYADRESLKQAVRIFVDNAVKYTPEGGKIALNSYINKKKIYIEIEDNGIGISKEDMNNIFNRFYRVDKSRTKESGGHGLGLSIAKWIISQHKGEIEVKSELNKGTVITLILSPMQE